MRYENHTVFLNYWKNFWNIGEFNYELRTLTIHSFENCTPLQVCFNSIFFYILVQHWNYKWLMTLELSTSVRTFTTYVEVYIYYFVTLQYFADHYLVFTCLDWKDHFSNTWYYIYFANTNAEIIYFFRFSDIFLGVEKVLF